jgi:hypothetical protein
MKVLTRTVDVPFAITPLVWHVHFGPASHWDNNLLIRGSTYSRPGYQPYLEMYTPNSDRSRMWKDFQHYKCWFSDPNDSSSFRPRIPVVTDGFGPPIGGIQGDYYTSDLIGMDGMSAWNVAWRASGSDLGDYPGLGAFNERLYSSLPDGGFIPVPSNIEDLKRIALASMLPRIRPRLSLINSIIELKDFRSLPRTIGKIKNLFGFSSNRSLRSILMGLSKSKLILPGMLPVTADLFLQKEFNIQPLLGDITELFRAVRSIEARVFKLLQNAGRPLTTHYVMGLNELTPRETSRAYNVGPDAQAGLYPRLCGHVAVTKSVPEQSQFHATLQYNYHYPAGQILHARSLALLDAIGVNLNPQIIWNAIPWSFVVDWVFGVSQFLGQFSKNNLEPVLNIRQFCWSIRRSRRIFCTLTSGNTGWADCRPQQTSLPVVTETAYRRDVGLPSSSLIQSSGLSLKEFSLGAALVLSRRKWRHRR